MPDNVMQVCSSEHGLFKSPYASLLMSCAAEHAAYCMRTEAFVYVLLQNAAMLLSGRHSALTRDCAGHSTRLCEGAVDDDQRAS